MIMKVLWSEDQQVLYVNGYQIAGEILNALVNGASGLDSPWRVLARDKGKITLQTHRGCLDVEKLELPPEPEMMQIQRVFVGFPYFRYIETEHSKNRRAFDEGQRLMRQHFLICLGLLKAPPAAPPGTEAAS